MTTAGQELARAIREAIHDAADRVAAAIVRCFDEARLGIVPDDHPAARPEEGDRWPSAAPSTDR